MHFIPRLALAMLLMAIPTEAVAQATLSPANERKLKIAETVATFGYIGTSIADAKFTYDCVKRGTCREANPFLAPIVNKHGIGAAMTAKVAFNLGVLGGINLIAHEWPERRKTVFFALLAANAVNVAVLTHNYRVLQR